jgi:hypothetical protein
MLDLLGRDSEARVTTFARMIIHPMTTGSLEEGSHGQCNFFGILGAMSHENVEMVRRAWSGLDRADLDAAFTGVCLYQDRAVTTKAAGFGE